ncbi:alcohol dehydrogenase [Asanoa ishikariensis]|uniref:Alcohol dehydrogenase n=1 Tax=Asanoa ishikariensis TaxID=137265 RepID=A0A1H3RU45_9ACTN|nr:zinc-binding dehydrogenase [Asanoa ishikariensis]GIF66817.1 alcohol dehydrogenase [Asanoa ishikariensis]SDZ29234.1 alcohol dehydrogenase [Asanoa ishikariensis]
MITTRAAVLEESGRPGPYAHSRPLTVGDLELRPPGTGEVLVRVRAAGLCHSDLSVIDGSRPRPLPMVLGHEAAGVVVEVGPDTRGVRVDDHVVFAFVPACGGCPPCQSGRPALCEPGAAANTAGTLLRGQRPFRRAGREVHHHLGVSAFSEYTVAAAESLVPVDRSLPLDRAALFGCALLTGVGAVVNTARARTGTAAAVFGLGGIGLAAVMGARAAGCHPVIAVDPVTAKHAVAMAAGATHTLTGGPDTVDAIRDLTHGGAEVAIEAVGSAAVLATAYAATRRGGTTVTVGLPDPRQILSIPAVSLVAEERTLRGSYLGGAVPRRDIPRYIALYRAGLLPADLLLGGRLRLDEINTGFDTLAAATTTRQVVVF